MDKKFFLLLLIFFIGAKSFAATPFFSADNPNIQYIGRIDFSDKKAPRFWQPGVYIQFKFSGAKCAIVLRDEVLYGQNYNYLEIVVDGKAYRTQTTKRVDTITVANIEGSGKHTLALYKSTEASIGYLDFLGVFCDKLLQPDAKPLRKMEFIGNSITCGASSDPSKVPCGTGLWHDQNNAYVAYGPVAARALNAQYFLSSVSGIGLMHSCCNMDIIMPQVYDKVSMRNDSIQWNFNLYQPDIVSICLGQNDGVQNLDTFVNNYYAFVKKIRTYYPHTTFLLLTSPMADDNLRTFLRKAISSVASKMKNSGDKKVYTYVFEKQYSGGCTFHPTVEEHQQIAKELVQFIQSKKIFENKCK